MPLLFHDQFPLAHETVVLPLGIVIEFPAVDDSYEMVAARFQSRIYVFVETQDLFFVEVQRSQLFSTQIDRILIDSFLFREKEMDMGFF